MEIHLKKIYMILTNGFDPDIRVLKEATYLSQKNYSVEILCWNRTSNSYPDQERISEKLIVRRFNHHSNPGTGLKQIWPFIKFIKSINSFLKNKEINYLHCHDFDGLLSGFLAIGSKKKKLKFKIIYDAHEFELGRNTNSNRGKIFLKFIKLIESYLIAKVDYFIFVSEYQQKEMSKIYKKVKSWILLRNIPPKWELDFKIIKNQRDIYFSKLKAKNITRIIMYHGYLSKGRGIENIIEALTKIPNTGFVILGKSSTDYNKSLLSLIQKSNLTDKVIIESHVNYDELWISVGSADLGLILTSDMNESEIMSLPNKLFENIQSLTPVIVSDFPAMRELVYHYDIGVTANPNNIIEIASKINELLKNQVLLDKYKFNLILAKEELNWNAEVKSLENIY